MSLDKRATLEEHMVDGERGEDMLSSISVAHHECEAFKDGPEHEDDRLRRAADYSDEHFRCCVPLLVPLPSPGRASLEHLQPCGSVCLLGVE